ncbi:MAG: PqiC family protein [Desulforhopalus sp.]
MSLLSYYSLVLILLITFLGSGCIGRTPQAHFYALSSLKVEDGMSPSDVLRDNIFIAIDSVKFPDEVDRPAIVTRLEPNQLLVDEFHRWAGTLEKNVARVMAENLAFLLNTDRVMTRPWALDYRPDVRIALDVREFTGYLGEYALLDVIWTITAKGNDLPVVVQRTVVKKQVTDRSYEAFVVAQSQAVYTLSQEIAEAVLEKFNRK